MDIKIKGLSFQQLREALAQARDGRHHIRKEMLGSISEPRADYKDHAPRIVSLTVPGEAIGPIIALAEKSFRKSKPKQRRPSALRTSTERASLKLPLRTSRPSMPPLLRSRPLHSHQPLRLARIRRQGQHHAIRRVCRGHSWTGRSASRERTD